MELMDIWESSKDFNGVLNDEVEEAHIFDGEDGIACIMKFCPNEISH
jgi:hypothetical protein